MATEVTKQEVLEQLDELHEEGLQSKLDGLRANVRRLLDVVGGKSQCRSCGAEIWFVKTKAGKQAPYTADALNHFADCPGAESFRRKQ